MKPTSAAPSRSRLALKLAAAGLALSLSGCVVAPYHRSYYHPVPRVRVWVPFPVWYVPVAGYHHGDGAYDRDRQECYRYAVRETGIDPGGMTPVQERGGSGGGGEVVAGAAVGAVAGGIVSSPRNAGAGMVIGAILGAAVGAASAESRERTERAERAERAERDSRGRRDAPEELSRDEQRLFRGAMSECMERRGYRPR